MPTQYTNDNKLGDFIIGQATGARYNFHSRLGADGAAAGRSQTVSPPVMPLERAPLPLGPLPQRTPEQIAELKRQLSNRLAIIRRPQWYKRLAGKVCTYLDQNGEVLADAKGDLAGLEVVSREDHVKRLKRAYEREWREKLARAEADPDEELTALRVEYALHRLDLLKHGRWVSPVGRKGGPLVLNTRQRKKTLFSQKVIPTRPWIVGPNEYDRRLRQFVFSTYCHGYASLLIDGTKSPFAPARETISAFINSPSVRRV